MAWSNAARAAALEARRAHNRAKPEAHRGMVSLSDFSRKIAADKGTRDRIARNLRAFRAGGKARKSAMKLGYDLQGLATEARVSTAVRNLLKKKRR